MNDYSPLSLDNQTNSELQEHYIFKTMRMFKVSDRLMQKAKDEFDKMAQDPQEVHPKEQSAENLSKEVIKSMGSRFVMEVKTKLGSKADNTNS